MLISDKKLLLGIICFSVMDRNQLQKMNLFFCGKFLPYKNYSNVVIEIMKQGTESNF